MKAIEISRYVIAKFDNVGDLITNKKLQKLLYYIEAWSLVHLDSIIDEEFEAWVHGPVIRNVYQEYKKHGYAPIVMDYGKSDSSKFIKKFIKESKIDENHIELIDSVLEKYGVLSSMELELLSHSEKPWIDARGKCSPVDHCSKNINKDLMKSFYSSLIA
jgi:uncharacterized phage-associated protein